MKKDLHFNILNFYAFEKATTLYFSTEKKGHCYKVHKYNFPAEIEKVLPNIKSKNLEKIYTTFTKKTAGFKPVEVPLINNYNLFKQLVTNQLIAHFKGKGLITKKNFIHDVQIWARNKNESNNEMDVYEKYTLKIQFKRVSFYPELIVSYDGQSKVLTTPVSKFIENHSPTLITTVINNTATFNYQYSDPEKLQQTDLTITFPLLNKQIATALNISKPAPPRDNRYVRYKEKIDAFRKAFLITDDFQKLFPLVTNEFIKVTNNRIGKVNKSCNELVFKNGIGDTPKTDFRTLKPLVKPPHKNIHLFYIYHKSHTNDIVKLDTYLKEGVSFFRGLQAFADIPFHTEKGFSITYTNDDNPLPEIIENLKQLELNPNVTYVAIYTTPFGKHDATPTQKKVYYRVKEELLKRRIVSQVIEFNKLAAKTEDYKYELTNIALALLAKLGGKPWQLNTSNKRELVIGVGAFKNVEENINYVASAFSFQNNGAFNEFDYFSKATTHLLSGAICEAIHQFVALGEQPDKVVIHFYKTMSQKEMAPIITEMNRLNLEVPLYIVNINKTDAKDIIAYDNNWYGKLLPLSGTFINLGNRQYLLFNNSRYSDNEYYPKTESYPFPIKLSISSPTENAFDDTQITEKLIEQVYQFSRLYWKSLRQQNVPITIKYPEMVAEIAPNFQGVDIPPHGKEILWFL